MPINACDGMRHAWDRFECTLKIDPGKCVALPIECKPGYPCQSSCQRDQERCKKLAFAFSHTDCGCRYDSECQIIDPSLVCDNGLCGLP